MLSVLFLTASPLWSQPTPLMRQHFGVELRPIVAAAKANDCHSDQLFTILLAIRKAENGRAGIEFGVLHPRAVDQPNSLRVQAGWCAATIRKNYTRWVNANDGSDFIDFLGNRYCPVGAGNDPNNLNVHWKTNVRHWVERFAGPICWVSASKSLEHPQPLRVYSTVGQHGVAPEPKGKAHDGQGSPTIESPQSTHRGNSGRRHHDARTLAAIECHLRHDPSGLHRRV